MRFAPFALLLTLLAGTVGYAQTFRVTGTATQTGNRVDLQLTLTPDGPPPPVTPLWGVLDLTTLGTCSQAVHDAHAVDGLDSFRYRTWHPQIDPSGCVYAHEHGDDPASQINAAVKARPVRFGYVGRRMNNHEEAHQGFKVFVNNAGDENDQGAYLSHSTLVFHHGTGGPARFSIQFHSMMFSIRTHDGRFADIEMMADAGDIENICNFPRNGGRTVVQLDPTCLLGSLYEIWGNKARVTVGGQVILEVDASTAAFDPITAMDPADPTRLLYTFDEAMNAVKEFPENDWSYVKGCDREVYHGPVIFFNETGRTVFFTDAMGNEVLEGPLALRQEFSASAHQGVPTALANGQTAFQFRRSHCAPGLGLKN